MYERFFGLNEPAFSLAPDPRLMWPSETHQEGLAALVYGITRRKGFLLLTGDVGVGKTTLVRAALEAIPDDIETAMVFHTAGLSAHDLLRLIAAEFRLGASLPTKADCILAIQDFLLQRLREKRNTVLIIDEAQNLDEATLEEVRLLSNLETDREKLLQIVLTGQTELLDKLASPRLAALRQRIALEHHVGPLRPSEIHAYLRFRIERAGGCFSDIFVDGVEPIFHEFASGRPRLINVLADRSLLAAFARGIRPVTPEIVKEKAEGLERLHPRGGGTPKGSPPQG